MFLKNVKIAQRNKGEKMESLYQETKFLMNKYHITANKALGQNFLIDEEVIEKMIRESNISKEDLIIEIGPGLGALTKHLLENAKKVICIELDQKMLNILNDRFQQYDNFELIHDDILKIDLNQLIQQQSFQNVKVVANLPYYITTPIIMKLLEERIELQSITVMVQKEVAQRLSAAPGGKFSGAVTYTVDYYAECTQIIEVPRNSFLPSPDVDSAVIKLELRKEPKVKVMNEELFFKVIKASFMQRRKTLINGLVSAGLIKTKDEANIILEQIGLNEKVRGEDLTIEQFAILSDKL